MRTNRAEPVVSFRVRTPRQASHDRHVRCARRLGIAAAMIGALIAPSPIHAWNTGQEQHRTVTTTGNSIALRSNY